MSDEKKMNKGKKVLIGIGIYLAVMAVVIAIISQTDEWKEAGEKTSASKSSTAAAQADVPLNEQIASLCKQNDKYNMKDLSVNVGVDGIITIRALTDGLTDDHLVQRSCSYALDVGQAVFNNFSDVQKIQYLFDSVFYDNLGNETKQKAVSFAFDRSVHSKMNYDNFKNMVMADYNSMWSAVSELYIHPAIRKNLKKLKL